MGMTRPIKQPITVCRVTQTALITHPVGLLRGHGWRVTSQEAESGRIGTERVVGVEDKWGIQVLVNEPEVIS